MTTAPKVLPDGVFVGMDSLFRVLVQYNLITELTNGTFRGINPFGIALNNNLITRIACGTFDHVSRLSLIGLQHNRLEEISCQFEQQVNPGCCSMCLCTTPPPIGNVRKRGKILGVFVD